MQVSIIFRSEWKPLIASLSPLDQLRFYQMIFSFDSPKQQINEAHLASVYDFISSQILLDQQKDLNKSLNKSNKARIAAQKRWHKELQPKVEIKKTKEAKAVVFTEIAIAKNNIELGFDKLWELMGKIGSKHPALAKYRIALKEISHDELMLKATEYMQFIASTGTYQKYVATWLKHKCWKDQLISPSQQSNIFLGLENERVSPEDNFTHSGNRSYINPRTGRDSRQIDYASIKID